MQTNTPILAEILQLMADLAGDWQYGGPLTAETRLLSDMGLKSLDLVILSTAIVKRYGRLPFDLFFTEIGKRPVESRDVTVRELVEFVERYVDGVSPAPASVAPRVGQAPTAAERHPVRA